MSSARARIASLVVLIAVAVNAWGATEVVNVVSRGDDNASYAIDMIRLGLQKVGQPFTLNITDDKLSANKRREKLVMGDVDVIWTATSLAMEDRALPVRIPLFKGLLGHRILLIHRDHRKLFEAVSTLEQAKRFEYGQGRGWTDTSILRANGLEVIGVNKYESLFHMTDGKRFHAFPRGVHEPWVEMAKRPGLALSVDRNIMFVYRMPYYLFVSPGRPDLASALERGLSSAIEDGSFDQLFYSNPMVQRVVKNADMDQRRIFNLQNPDLPPKTPLNRPELWVDLVNLRRAVELGGVTH